MPEQVLRLAHGIADSTADLVSTEYCSDRGPSQQSTNIVANILRAHDSSHLESPDHRVAVLGADHRTHDAVADPKPLG